MISRKSEIPRNSGSDMGILTPCESKGKHVDDTVLSDDNPFCFNVINPVTIKQFLAVILGDDRL